MAHSYNFAVLQVAPDDGRNERVNIGTVVFQETRLDVRWARRLEKLRVFSHAIDVAAIRDIVDGMSALDSRTIDRGILAPNERRSSLAQLGPIALSELGSFEAETSLQYEERIESIMRHMVEPEPAAKRARLKRSRLLTQLKANFRDEKVLARKDEDLDSHRVVPAYELDEGLVADLVLKNGALHVIETVDASDQDEAPRRTIADVALAGLVLERARMRFGSHLTQGRLVYSASPALEKTAHPALAAVENQGAQLINWASVNDRTKFVHSIAALASPRVSKRRLRGQVFAAGETFWPRNSPEEVKFANYATTDASTASRLVFVEPLPRGRVEGSPVVNYVVEDRSASVLFSAKTQSEAIDWAKAHGRSPHVARVRHLNDKRKPDHWRKA